MAAIYAYLPVTKLFLTSKPYPIYAKDELTEEQSIIDLYMIDWVPVSLTESFEFLDASLEHKISYSFYTIGLDTLTENFEFLWATLTQEIDYLSFDGGEDYLTESFEFLGATLTPQINYIYITQPPDNVTEDMDILSIVLAAP